MGYAIVQKNRVIVGPMAWAQNYFTTALRVRHRIQANIPMEAPETLPYTVDENTKIHAVIEDRPEINTMTHHYYGPLWDMTNDVIVAKYEVHEIEINAARDNFRAVAAAERYRKEVAGTKTTLQGLEVTLDTSREGRNIFIQKLMIMSDAETVNWKFPEGWLTITKADLTSVVAAGARHIQDCFDWEKGINEKIDNCMTLDELVSLTIVETPVVENGLI